MARKREPIRRDPAEPVRPVDAESKRMTINVRSTVAYNEWLNEFADSCGLTVSKLIDEALLHLARERGYKMPPKR